MNTFLLSFDATTTFSGGNPPTLEILVGGVVVSSLSMTSGASSYDLFIEYSGDYPSSLSLRFDGSSGDPGDTISFTAVSVNDTALNLVTDLTATLLAQAQSAAVSAANDLYGHTAPTLGTTTISGTGGDDSGITSSNDADTIDAMAGNDWVFGRGGDDEINGGAGADFLFGEGGNDTILAGTGDDFVMGNDGDDILFGEGDNDFMMGGAGSDLINGGAGNDSITGDADDDVIFGEDGDDWITGDAGDDIIFGDNGADFLLGGTGNDSIAGGDGADQLIGDTGNDLLSGGAGDDEIVAGTGADIASGGAGDDNIYGDDGDDELAGGDDDDYITGGDGADTLSGDAGIDIVIGGDGADTINGGAGADVLHGGGLDSADISDILFNNASVSYSEDTGSFYQFVSANVNYATAAAAAAASTLNGVAGHLVTITSAAESDYVGSIVTDDSFTSGQDTAQDGTWQWNAGLEAGIQFSNQSGTAQNNMYEDWDTGQPQNNTEYNVVYQNSGDVWHDWADTSTHSYVIEWESGLMSDDGAADTINGDAGDDMIYGQDGDDILDGGADNDVVIGGDGSDTVDGGTGADVLYAYDGTVETAAAITAGSTVTILDEAFGTNTGVFSYSDGGFGGTDGANVSVTGTRRTSDGNLANGSLEVYVDGQNNSSFTNGSGSWDASVSHTTDLSNVQITFSYRHWHANQNDTNEDSEVYLEFNGTIYDTSGGNSFISEALGSGGATDTGWVTVTIDLPDLTASTAYNLSMGILHVGSSRSNEDARIRFDDITITGDEPAVGGPPTTNTADIGETNTVNGGDGADTIYGSAGTDTLNGDDGDDTIYSAAADEAWDTAVADILTNNSGVVYSEETNSFYQYISTAATFTNANNTATTSTLTGLTGVNGYIATITSQAEQDYIWNLGGGNSLWGGANDTGTEGTWVWQNGDDNGLQFWSGGDAASGGAATNSHYENWIPDGTEPWDGAADYDYFILRSANGGQWWTENNDATTFDYVIEWDARTLLTTVDYTTIDGGAGDDTLYGNDGLDTFVYDSATWSGSGDVDTIENFSATGRDAIDISDLLTGYTYTGSDINDFVTLTEASGNTTIAVDANGTTGGSSYTDVAVLNGVTGLDLYQMIAADNLIVA